MSKADDNELVFQYLAQALELREAGVEPPLADICRAHPGLIERVQRALGSAPELAGLEQSAQSFDPLQGRVLAQRYRLEQRIGAGAMGVVYRALDVDLQRPVAVKVLQTELFGGTEAAARFGREALVLAALRHPAVITVFDRGQSEDGISYLVMELLHGAPLSELLEHFAGQDARDASDDTAWLAARLGPDCRSEKSWLRQAVAWTADLAAGLHAAHQAGVFHRDVKPSNVFVDRQGCARLLDFGIAARAAHPTLANRQHGLGTPAYMAPEQVEAGIDPTAALDVYGLAATLYHLITLRPPHLGTPSQVLASLQRRDPLPAYKLRRGLPRDLQAVLDCGMARSATRRYATAADMEADLRRFLAYQPVRARALTPVGRLWHRAKRSPVARTLAVIVTVAWIWIAAAQWHRARMASDNQEALRALSKLPPNIGLLEAPASRAIEDPAERSTLAALLDDAARARDVLPGLLYRAAFRHDHGDPRRAAEDIATIAARHPTTWTRALLARYRDLAPTSRSALDIRAQDLTQPTTPIDRYLLAYHLLRISADTHADTAASLVDIPELADMPAALEMLGPPLLVKANACKETDRDLSLALLRKAHDLAIRLEALQGHRSAMSAYLLGNALVGMQRHRDAIVPLQDGRTLSPYAAGLRTTLAQALAKVGRPAQARDELLAAIATRRRHLRAHISLIDVLFDLGEIDAARAHIDAIPFPDTPQGSRLRQRQAGLLEYRLSARALLNNENAVEPARRAVQLLESSAPDSRHLRFARSIASGDSAEICAASLELALADPLDADALNCLASTLPREPNEHVLRGLRQLLEDLADEARRHRDVDTSVSQATKHPTTQVR